jgi:hypothetical protein
VYLNLEPVEIEKNMEKILCDLRLILYLIDWEGKAIHTTDLAGTQAPCDLAVGNLETCKSTESNFEGTALYPERLVTILWSVFKED